MRMGRVPTININLPRHMRARKKPGGTYYYYDTGGKPRREIPLGNNYIDAVKKWAELEGKNAKPLIYFKDVADRYLREIMPLKAARTQDDNIKELENLMAFFNNPPAPMSEILPQHIRIYLDARTDYGKHSTVRANRERALFSHIFNMARSWGAVDTANPCQGIKGFTEKGRTIYIEDSIFNAVYDVATQPLKDALDLAYLTGARPADTVKLSETNIQNDELVFQQNKTGGILRLSITGDLKKLINSIVLRKKSHKVRTLQLICTETGRPISQNALRLRFEDAREKAARLNPSISENIKAFQFRDLRAKAGSDKAESGDMREAQLQLGHGSMAMTEHYVRARRGQKTSPTR
jgi:integrase